MARNTTQSLLAVVTLDNLYSLEDMINMSNFSIQDFWRLQSQAEFSNSWFGPVGVCVLVLTFSIIGIFGILGNTAMCYIIIRKRNMKTCRNWYILNLSISDILTSVLCIPFTVVKLIMKNWPLGELLCKGLSSLQTIYVLVSTFTIVLIAVDRYNAIVQCTMRDRTRPRYIFVMVWLVSFALALPMFIYHEVESVCITKDIILFSSCLEKWDSDIARRSYASLILCIHFVFPIIVIISLHILICKFIRTHIESKPSYSRELHRSRRNLLRQRKNIILLTSITVIFALTWLPLTLINLLADINYQLFTGIDFNVLIGICHVLAMSSVCINPIVYGWFNSNYRREIKEIMLCCKFQNKDADIIMFTRYRNRIELEVNGYVSSRADNRETKTLNPRTAEVRHMDINNSKSQTKRL